ncbi:MAG: hypothetical protein LBF77_01425 [Spirochaetaceae bacterium]|jgi:hypothetical protein|nr:hypothetical protein [Spirochaetaceae bacterium]
MNNNVSGAAFFVFTCLTMTVFTVTGVNAQVSLPGDAPKPAEIEHTDIPGEIAGYTPHSGVYRATMGTISSDVDVFMSVFDFSAVKMRNWFSYAGVDEKGVNLGYAVKLGSAYFGISYGGSLIDEILRRITNQNILTLQKRDEIRKDSSGTSAKPGLVDSEGKPIEGITTSENTVGLIFGAGVFGLKLGFAAHLEGREIGSNDQNYEQAFESSLKPSLELGWNFPVGSVRTKIAIRGAYDMYQYISVTGETFYYMPADSIESSFVVKEMYQDFTEPSGGLTLGFEFGLGRNTRAEFDLIGDAAYRIYRSNEQDGIMTTWKITNPVVTPLTSTNTEVAAPEIFDLRISGNPVFALTSDVSDRLTIGGRISLAMGYDIFTISQSLSDIDENGNKTPVSAVKISDSRLSVTPELGIGTRFTLWPDHFSMHAGFGIDLFSYSETISARITTIGGVDTETTDTLRVLDLPTTKITAGLTLNLTTDLALDLLAITSGLDIDATKLTILLTLNK